MELRTWCLLLIVACALPAHAQDAPAPTTQNAAAEEFLKSQPPGPPSRTAERTADVINFKLDDGLLLLTTNQGPTQGGEQIRIKDRPGFCTIDIGGEMQVTPWTPDRLNFSYYNLAHIGKELVQVLYHGASLQIAYNFEQADGVIGVALIQGARTHNDESPGVSLNISGIPGADGSSPRMHVTAASFDELLAKYPRETSLHLLPVFEDLRQAKLFAVNSRLAWQVFSDALVPDEKTIEQIQKTIARLDADAYADREAAFADLQKLGQAATGYISRMDRSKLSPEQRSRIDEFLSGYQPLDPAQAKQLRSDVHFLLNCFYNDDKSIREQALKHLRIVTKTNFDLPIDLPDGELETRVAQVRAKLTRPSTTQPTTAPTPAREQP